MNLSVDFTIESLEPSGEVSSLINSTLLSGGKRLRPMLVFTVGQGLGVDLTRLAPYARAAEFTHTASLAHDDVIDHSHLRRGKPTISALATGTQAVLAGDILLAQVMMELALIGDLDVVHDLAQAIRDMSLGEWLEVNRRRRIPESYEELENIHRLKTGSLMGWCIRTPVRLAKGSDRLISLASTFGEAIGFAFQLVDDLLDFSTSGEKPFAQDLREHTINWVSFEVLRARPQLNSKVSRLFSDHHDDVPVGFDEPFPSAEWKTACEIVRSKAQAILEGARTLIGEMEDEAIASGMAVDRTSFALLEDSLQEIVERTK